MEYGIWVSGQGWLCCDVMGGGMKRYKREVVRVTAKGESLIYGKTSNGYSKVGIHKTPA